MPVRKHLVSFGRTHWKELAILAPPFLALLAIAVCFSGDHPRVFMVCFIVAFPIPIIGLVRGHRRNKRWPCEQCGRVMQRPAPLPDERILFHCPDCDIEWDTGFIQAGGD